MVNKNVLHETFMKLESYDRVNVISEILRLSNTFELEFYSTVIENILQYHKFSINSLREELNHDSNFKYIFESDCADSSVRSKLISTLSLLKASNVNGASQIFEFLRLNHLNLIKQAHDNSDAYEEVLLIYQLANDHPAFSFNHCQEIYDYLTQIRLISVSKDYFDKDDDENIIDLNLVSISKNTKQEYIYRIKVKWDNFECCIIRSLEDVYRFYQKICEMFPLEISNGEICNLYISYIPDNLELSLHLMSTFFCDFLKSPQLILRCNFVRQFFKPRSTDRKVCDCDSCQFYFNKLHWTGIRRLDFVVKCNSPVNPSDNEEDGQFCDSKTDTNSSSTFNYSCNSKYNSQSNPSSFEVTNIHRTCSEDDSVFLKLRRTKSNKYYSSGSSPINTPSEESEICSKNESLKNHISGYNRQLSMVIENTNMTSPSKDIRTENWITQFNDSQSTNDIVSDSMIDLIFDDAYIGKSDEESINVSNISHCHIGNLYQWLKHSRLHKYYNDLFPMNFGQFYSLTEEALNQFLFPEGASRKLLILIRNIKRCDIICIDSNTVNITLRKRCNSSDSVTSITSSYGGYSIIKPDGNPAIVNVEQQVAIVIPFRFPLLNSSSCCVLPQGLIQNFPVITSNI